MVILAFGMSGCVNTDESADESPADEAPAEEMEVAEPLDPGTFAYHEDEHAYYGILPARGYVTLVDREEAWCEKDCEMLTYVFFNILETENEAIDGFMEMNTGNAFAGDGKIGLGYLENGSQIRFMNDSDENGMVEEIVPDEDAHKLMEATEENPVTVELERLKFTGGAGAPSCYSHFSKITLE